MGACIDEAASGEEPNPTKTLAFLSSGSPEAEEARERLARASDSDVAPNRNPPVVDEPLASKAIEPIEPVDAAE